MLPRILSVLDTFCEEENINGFESFSAALNALPDPLLGIAFMPFDDSQLSLSLSEVHQCIGAPCLLETDVSVTEPCCLGVWLVGENSRNFCRMFLCPSVIRHTWTHLSSLHILLQET